MTRRIQSKFIALGLAIALAMLVTHSRGASDSRDGSDSPLWSLRAVVRQAKPVVVDRDWPVQPVDYFVLASLERHGLVPSPAADPATLIRRLTFDLTGLPPTRQELHEFLADDRMDAYSRLVDRLLASPHFGERMASFWLPLARYAEDQAHQVGDDTKYFYPHAYKYREWVVSAFNRDLAYDQFLSLQLAADKIAGAEPGDLAALGFLGLGPKYYARNRLDVMADEWEDRVDTVSRTMLGLTVACARCHDHKFEPITQEDYYALAGVFASTRMVNKTPDGRVEKGDVKADKLDPATLHIVEDGEVQDLNIFLRGNVDQKGPVAQRRFLQALCGEEPLRFYDGSGRAELAGAIAGRDNPLTSRVLVNRVWGWLFGKGLVGTPSNFGRSGQLPTHPELLDDLAARFVENGGSVKWLVRELVSSAAYRQSSRFDAAKAQEDAENVWLWRMNRRRQTVEQWRDSVLFVAGHLEQGGGRSLELTDPANWRRTLYARISRLKLNDLLMQFDYPDANVHAEDRETTTTPTQKLFMLNGDFVMEQAVALTESDAFRSEGEDERRVIQLYEQLFCRPPSLDELRLAVDFLSKPTAAPLTRWQQYVQMLLVSNEMWFLD